MLFTFFLFVLTGRMELAWIVGVEFFFPVILRILLAVDSHHVQLSFQTQETCLRNQSIGASIQCHLTKMLLVTSGVEVYLHVINHITGEQKTERVFIATVKKEEFLQYLLKFDMCGLHECEVSEVKILDVFGFYGMTIPFVYHQNIVVNPEPLHMQVMPSAYYHTARSDGYVTFNQHGNDSSEVFELREYTPGDDVRSIHWKVSTKLNELLVKESSQTIQMDTLVVFDGGMESEEGKTSHDELSSAMEVCATMMQKLLEQGIHYRFAYLDQLECVSHDVLSENDYFIALSKWMSTKLPQHSHKGLPLLQEQLKVSFSKLIYVTVGDCSEEIAKLKDDTNVTAICVYEDGEGIQLLQRGNSHIMHLPVPVIQKQALTIYY